MPILSWITGWVNCSGWVALVATGGLLGSQLILGCISLMNPVRAMSTFSVEDPLLTVPSELRGPALAPISDLRRLQHCWFPHQCFRKQHSTLFQQGCIYVVADRIRCYFYHGALLFFRQLQLW